MDTFTKRLQYIMSCKKIDQAKFAKESGFHKSQVSKWLSGLTETPQQKTLFKLADYFGCNIDWLENGTGEPFGKVQMARIGAAALKEQTRRDVKKNIEHDQMFESSEPERNMIRMYRQLAEMDADTFGEIQTWINDMEKIRPGFTGWFRIEFQNRFPEFDEWKRKLLKKSEAENHQNGTMGVKSVNGY